MELISLIFDALFIFLIMINAWLTSKSIDKLERKVKELEEKEVLEEAVKKHEEVKPIVKKKRTRKPKAAKEIV